MKNLILVIVITLFLSHCKSISQETQTNTITPTKPEGTEVWKPKVPVVTAGVNNKAPSDALVLFLMVLI